MLIKRLAQGLASGFFCLAASATALAADPDCGSSRRTVREPDCGTEEQTCCKKTVFVPVPVPLCHGLKCLHRPWFLSTEPPRADVLEAVAIRREQAPVADRELRFEIVQTPQNRDLNALESACSSSRNLTPQPTPPAPVVRAPEATCQTTTQMQTEMQTLRADVNQLNSNLGTLQKDIGQLKGYLEIIAENAQKKSK